MENTDLCSIFKQEDELQETLQSFKYHQEGVNKDLHRCLHHPHMIIAQLAVEIDEMVHVMKNLHKHFHMIETQCEQTARTQSINLDQSNNDSFVTYHVISTRSGKQTQEPKGPTWWEEEQVERRRESQRQIHDEEELQDSQDNAKEESLQLDAQDQEREEEVEDTEEIDSDAKTNDARNEEDKN